MTATNPTAPAITFAIPYFRDADYLVEAIDSVRRQTTADWEIIVVDDAGPDDARQRVADIGDDRISYVRNAVNLGLAGNWNECLRRANAPLVTLLHADDRLRPGYAVAVIAAATAHPDVAAVFTDAAVIGADGRPKFSLPDEAKRLVRRPPGSHVVAGDSGLAALTTGNYLFCPTLAYRANMLDDDPFDGRWSFMLDLDHTARLLLNGQRLFGVREALYEYRRHGANQTSSMTADARRFEEEIAFSRELAQRAVEHGWPKTARAAQRRLMVRTHLALRMATDAARGRFRAANGKRLILQADLRRRRPIDPPA